MSTARSLSFLTRSPSAGWQNWSNSGPHVRSTRTCNATVSNPTKAKVCTFLHWLFCYAFENELASLARERPQLRARSINAHDTQQLLASPGGQPVNPRTSPTVDITRVHIQVAEPKKSPQACQLVSPPPHLTIDERTSNLVTTHYPAHARTKQQ
jgi:hypothetical protein